MPDTEKKKRRKPDGADGNEATKRHKELQKIQPDECNEALSPKKEFTELRECTPREFFQFQFSPIFLLPQYM